MKIAGIGSRFFPRPDFVDAIVAELPPDTIIRSGAAPGPDAWFAWTAWAYGLAEPGPDDIIKADWNKYGRAAGMMRNGPIVAGGDGVVALYDGRSRGTRDAMDKARGHDKPLLVVTPDGLSELYSRAYDQTFVIELLRRCATAVLMAAVSRPRLRGTGTSG